MSPLLKIRAERDQMSAIERRIADFLLDNAHLLRDYSSQQLASALGISQSSVVKFSQKLGFKGYPDLKFSIGEALAREGAGEPQAPDREPDVEPHLALAESLWCAKAQAEQETRLINPVEQVDAIVQAICGAERVFICGLGQDGIHARGLGLRLSLIGIATVEHADPVLMAASVCSAGPRDVLIVFSEHGKQPELCHISRQFRERRGRIISVTRHSANPLRASADAALLVSAHDERTHVEPLLYQAALQHMLDLILVLVGQHSSEYAAHYRSSLEHIQQMLDP
ncbi:MurR/RpiR family transcriptional regulator [Marilutibacter alkalisoli]|uniref:MurR/RpiR family transcriptional regulator n=1 Tax=Marilutibacter alkalisoli TaxID=2591633 RepID=A0A514BR36_9GAMM|nr:MurR/RpiR family transcriptional regulator [Lysobacter alkalisoli]QDH69853.1 MurR/RpiR family transcriptional regulator [Lysobacter alkalisoli]